MLENHPQFVLARKNISLSNKIKERQTLTLGQSNKKMILSQDFNKSLKRSQSFQMF